MSGIQPVGVRDAALRLAEHGIQAANAYGRTDLAARLGSLVRREDDDLVRVVVVGEFKQGKSSLVNALVGSDVCPVDEDVPTAIPTLVRHGATPGASTLTTGADGSVERSPIGLDEIEGYVCSAGAPDGPPAVQQVDIDVPAPLLRGGLALVDLPGAGGLGSFHGAAALAMLPLAQAVVVVSDAGQELVDAELAFVRRARSQCPKVALVKSRVDIHPAWRRIVAADTAHVADVTSSVFAVSSELAARGERLEDDELVAESGIGALRSWLRKDVLHAGSIEHAVDVADAVVDVAVQIAQSFRAERAALADDQGNEVVEQLSRARDAASHLRTAASRWQQALVDAFTDLNGDVDHNLRGATRDLLREAEEAIDNFDPAKAWQEYEPDVRRRVADLVAQHYQELHLRVEDAAQVVATVLAADTGSIEQLVQGACHSVHSPEADGEGGALGLKDTKRAGVGSQALTLLRASYGSALMVGFLSGVVGLAAAAPAVLAVGLAMGSRGLRQENQRQLAGRRAAAKAAVRRYVDDVSFVVAKDSRDNVRRAQRHLRDFFAGHVDELNRSTTAALQAAQDAVNADESTRGARARDLDAELERLDWLVSTARDVRGAVEKAGAR